MMGFLTQHRHSPLHRMAHAIGTLSTLGSILLVLGGLAGFGGLFFAGGISALTSDHISGLPRMAIVAIGLGVGTISAVAAVYGAVIALGRSGPHRPAMRGPAPHH